VKQIFYILFIPPCPATPTPFSFYFCVLSFRFPLCLCLLISLCLSVYLYLSFRKLHKTQPPLYGGDRSILVTTLNKFLVPDFVLLIYFRNRWRMDLKGITNGGQSISSVIHLVTWWPRGMMTGEICQHRQLRVSTSPPVTPTRATAYWFPTCSPQTMQ
jgi:hypothetical protein